MYLTYGLFGHHLQYILVKRANAWWIRISIRHSWMTSTWQFNVLGFKQVDGVCFSFIASEEVKMWHLRIPLISEMDLHNEIKDVG